MQIQKNCYLIRVVHNFLAVYCLKIRGLIAMTPTTLKVADLSKFVYFLSQNIVDDKESWTPSLYPHNPSLSSANLSYNITSIILWRSGHFTNQGYVPWYIRDILGRDPIITCNKKLSKFLNSTAMLAVRQSYKSLMSL